MKSKYLALGLSLTLMLGMAACGGQQAQQEPKGPEQEIQQTEPVTTEPTAPPVETEPQEEPKQEEITGPVEVEDNDPEGEVSEPATVTTAPEAASVPTETPSQEPVETKSPESAPTAQQGDIGTISIKDTAEQQEVQVTEQNPVGTVWDQAFYDSLTPSQQESYRSGDDFVRQQMQQFIEASRDLEAKGYQGNESTDPEENLKSWSQITVGS